MTQIARLILVATRALVVALAVVFIAVVLWGVASRYVLGWAVAWTEELAVFIMIWLTFLGISIAAHERAHIGMEALRDRLPPQVRRYMVLAMDGLMVIFLGVVVSHGAYLALSVTTQRSAALRISFFWPYISIPVGAALMMLQLCVVGVRDFTREGHRTQQEGHPNLEPRENR